VGAACRSSGTLNTGMPADSPSSPPGRRGPGLGLPPWLILALAGLAAPQVLLHGTGWAPDSPIVEAGLLLAPPLAWIAAAEQARVPSPVATVTVIGTGYGVLLAILHNVLWDGFIVAAASPALEQDLSGDLPPAVVEIATRLAVSLSSVLTGVVMGLLTGLIAKGLRILRSRRRPG
jgi:hypothetical protein